MMVKDKTMIHGGGEYWKKLVDATQIGLTAEEFEEIESLDSAIVHLEGQIEDFSRQIELIKRTAQKRREEFCTKLQV